MPFQVSKGGAEFEKPKNGSHNAVVFGVWDVGVHLTKDGKEKQQAVIGYEIAQKYTYGEFEGKPMYCMQKLNASLHENAVMRKVVEAIIGRPLTQEEVDAGEFQESWILGKPCTIVVKDGWANDTSPMINGLQPLKPTLLNYVPKWITTLRQKAIVKGGQTLSEMNQDNPADDFYNGTGFNENPVVF